MPPSPSRSTGARSGHEVAPGRFRAGEVVVADIGLEHRSTEHARVLPEIARLVPRRRPGDTKYTAGSVLVVGGSPGMTGAVVSGGGGGVPRRRRLRRGRGAAGVAAR